MLDFDLSSKVYLACGSTDLRKSIDGLAAIVQQRFHINPFSNCLFVFCNRNRDKIKILRWDNSGFWLFYKRLENGKFQWPTVQSDVKSISTREFRWLLDGLSPHQPKAHQGINAKHFV
jgi:transposase